MFSKMARELINRLQDALKLLDQYLDGLDSCIMQLEAEMPEETILPESSESLALYRLREAAISISDAKIKLLISHGLLSGELDLEEEKARFEKEEEEELNKYMANMKEPKPIIYPEEITLPTRKLITDLAKIELEELSFQKKHAEVNEWTSLDFVSANRNMVLNKKGFEIRNALLNSDLASRIRELKDPVEEMKSLAAMLLFLYSHERRRHILTGKKLDESFYYAGANMYWHAAILQKMFEDVEKEDE